MHLTTLYSDGTHLSGHVLNISVISSISLSCIASLRASGYLLNFLFIFRHILRRLVFSGSGTYGTQLKYSKQFDLVHVIHISYKYIALLQSEK